jgi:uncharacterized membrane protein YqjE
MRPDEPFEANKPFPVLLRELAEQIATLVREEFALAKVELAEKGRRAAPAAGMLGASALLGLGAFGALTTCIIAALALALQAWAAALIVAVLYAIIAFVIVYNAKKKFESATPLVPEQTVQSVKEDVEWAKTRARSGKT